MGRYKVCHSYRSHRAAFIGGEVIECDEELAAWVSADSPGTLEPADTKTAKAIERAKAELRSLTGPAEDRMARPASNRAVYRVLPCEDGWKVDGPSGDEITRFGTKAEAATFARDEAKGNQPSQVVVHKADGTIGTEWTYEADPPEREG